MSAAEELAERIQAAKKGGPARKPEITQCPECGRRVAHVWTYRRRREVDKTLYRRGKGGLCLRCERRAESAGHESQSGRSGWRRGEVYAYYLEHKDLRTLEEIADDLGILVSSLKRNIARNEKGDA